MTLLLTAACGTAATSRAPSPTGTNASPTPSTTPHINLSDLTGRIVFSRAGGQYGDETVFIADADGSDERQLSPFDAAAEARFRRDGGRLLYATGGPDGRLTFTTMNLDGSN